MLTCGEGLIRLLESYGVDTVFGIPGNHTLELYRGLSDSKIKHVTTRHEQGAGFMADGYARVTGKPGVCFLVSGPGLLNAATAIGQARGDSIPMLVISGVAATNHLGESAGRLHELPDQQKTAATFCRWSKTLRSADELSKTLAEAFATFKNARPGPVHIEIPLDVMASEYSGSTDAQPVAPRPPVDDRLVNEAVEALNHSGSPLILVGGGAIKSADLIVELAERLDAPVLNTVNGKGICNINHPLAVGGSPSLDCLRQEMQRADWLVAIGTEVGETDYDLLMADEYELSAKVIRMDIDAAQINQNLRADIGLLGDAGDLVSELLLNLEQASRKGAERAGRLAQSVKDEFHYHQEIAGFFAAIQQSLPEVIVVGDSTRPTYYAAWQYECEQPRSYFHSASGFGTLGYAIPAAFGACFGTLRPVLALIGDGAAQFTLPELAVAAEQGLTLPIVIWNNQGYKEIENSLSARGVDTSSTLIASPDFSAIAQAYRCDYVKPANLAEFKTVLQNFNKAPSLLIIEVDQTAILSTPSGGWYGDAAT